MDVNGFYNDESGGTRGYIFFHHLIVQIVCKTGSIISRVTQQLEISIPPKRE